MMDSTNDFQYLRDKEILIWGFGREGRSTHRFLRHLFPQKALHLADREAPDDFYDENTIFLQRSGWCADFDHFDLVFRSPGIPLLDPAIRREKLSSQTNLFLSRYAAQTIGITGTKGKSTTAALIHHVLTCAGQKSILLGNIGLPCLDYAAQITPETRIVFELSCHQLEDARFSPATALHLNLFEDHLDHYGSFSPYASAKKNIFTHQEEGARLLLGENLREHYSFPPHAQTIGYDKKADVTVYVDRVSVGTHTLPLNPARRRLPGLHNNYCIGAAFWVCRSLSVPDDCFIQALDSFEGLPHRLQYIGTVDGVAYYDDSISTICEATQRALEALGDVDCLLLGGMDRGIDYSPLVRYFMKNPVPHVILMPDSGWRIAPLLKEQTNCALYSVSGLEEAVSVAKQVTQKGKSCLLSPAAASYGFFRDFAERGDCFRRLVTGKG